MDSVLRLDAVVRQVLDDLPDRILEINMRERYSLARSR